MEKFFCSDASRQADEDIIGSGTNYETYILVECPPPWSHTALESKTIPDSLRELAAEIKQRQLPARILLIANNKTRKKKRTKVLIYDQKKERLSKGYAKTEFVVSNLDDVAKRVRDYFAGNVPPHPPQFSKERDIIICTHGSHDACCARYGNPFYMKALANIAHLGLPKIRLWKASHFGGHRFAPTAIDFPEGRYYGKLDQDSFKSILTRTGDIQCLRKVYRGWGILPTEIQVLERELILKHGWDWFNYKVAGTILERHADDSLIKAEITFAKTHERLYSYRAELIRDEQRTLCLKGSCHAAKPSEFVKYSVENLHLHSTSLESLHPYREKTAS
jgi:hypothetical protein